MSKNHSYAIVTDRKKHRAAPIIDVHSHIFNARDIPLKGYLLSRKASPVVKFVGRGVYPLLARGLRRELNPAKSKSVLFDLLSHLALAVVGGLMGLRPWADTLSKGVKQVACEMMQTFQKDEIDLYIPLMLDYEYWFKNTPDNPLECQIEYIAENIVLPGRGKIHPFVPFDPAREIAYRKKMRNPDGNLEQSGSLILVKEAIEKKGFIGVKLYNAMGYKPLSNETVEAIRRRIALHRKRYVFKGQDYDDVLSALYDYCAGEEVPITAHCGFFGIESYHDASFDFGKAIFWRDVLSQKKYQKLRLNLAHFGWSPKYGYRGKYSWVRDICQMLEQYENLYTDVALHEPFTEKYLPKYMADYKAVFSDFPIVKQRLLFGIDWHVIKRVKHFESFKDKFLELFAREDLLTSEEIEGFLGGNALRFLGMLPGMKNRERLAGFYRVNHIDPPGWFRSAG